MRFSVELSWLTFSAFVCSDTNTLVETVSFAALSKIQPFLVSITTSSVLLMDFHCHLTKTEVCGYLGGSWDLNSHSEFVGGAVGCRLNRSSLITDHCTRFAEQRWP